jgi:hypothetical protein
MSYTPGDQLLNPSAERIVLAINDFDDAARQRVLHPEEWRADHLHELAQLQADLAKLRARLTILMKGTH